MIPEVVWFKRDLRIDDHAPLTAAAKQGAVLCLYIYEPALIHAEDFGSRHLLFINDSLRELEAQLVSLGSRLVICRGDAVQVLAQLQRQIGFTRIRVHQETTNGVSYDRDRAVLEWAGGCGVEIVEYRQNGVVRRLQSREGWASQWQAFAAAPLVKAPREIQDGSGNVSSVGVLSPEEFGLPDDGLNSRQQGGISKANKILNSFLKQRSASYLRGLSSPVTAWDSCSRLSPYLAHGNVSLRTVYQRALLRRRELQRMRGRQDPWSESLTTFIERLHWHCHFMQKLEDEPAIEFTNMNPAFDGLREKDFNEDYFTAWCEGRTGYPMVDACMRALIDTGWINFRMRAMLVSFSSYHLWLHWCKPALHLARLFVDYEPGIHYSQVQMQSGTTGINATRIYSPTKQVLDQDPDGEFIRGWLPELAKVPGEFIAEPWLMPKTIQEQAGCLIGTDYPAPIVDHLKAYRAAQQRLRTVKLAARASGDSDRVFTKHGSRRGPRRRPMSARVD
jgi:deoxyribodipyrimidine photo-lyase